MGLFTSHCPYCDSEIHWFLQAPEDYICNCGRHVTVKEIREDWHRRYTEHLKKVFEADKNKSTKS